MKKLLFILFFVSGVVFAQQGNIWYFGNQAGLDFNVSPPVALTNGQMSTNEGCASISNSSGQLLFYTDGIKVWNTNHALMPNANGSVSLGGNPSSSQSGIIVPDPGNINKYYIFAVSAYTASNVKYSRVDMTLNGGLGDVEVSTRAVSLVNATGEYIQAVLSADGSFYWVLVHKAGTNSYYAYQVTSTGVNLTPVISSTGSTTGSTGDIGYIKFNSSGNKLVRTGYLGGYFDLCDFNRSTGVVSNAQTFTNANAYGAEFSPNGNLLYISSVGSNGTRQYNLNAGTTAQILASGISLGSAGGAIQSAPDGALYIAGAGSSISKISSPNITGAGCGYTHQSVSLAGKTSTYGLPNIITSFVSTGPPVLNSLASSNILCNSADIDVTVSSDGGSPITSRGFYYGTSPSPTTNQTLVSGTTGLMTASLTGLAASTQYYYRAFATNSNGTSYLGDGVFTTPACTSANAAPTISTPTDVSLPCSGTATSPANFTVADAEIASNLLVVSATSSNTTLIPNANLVVTQPTAAGAGSVAYTIASGQSGTSTITLTVQDDLGATSTSSFNITVSAGGTPENILVSNSLCGTNTLQWMTMNNVTATTASGTGQNGITVAVTHSVGGMSSNDGMYQSQDYPSQYNVPTPGTPVIRNTLAGDFQACFSQPVVNPVVAFASIGNPSTPVVVTVSQPYSIVWSGTGTTWTSSTQFTGQEGDNIIRIDGTVSCVNFNYGTSETYATVAFGFENQNCYTPTICSGQSVTLTASGATNYSWSPSTGLNTTSGTSVIANPTTTTTYTVTNPSNVCATPASVTVVVNPTPVITSALSNQVVCSSDVIAAQSLTSDVTGTTFTWTNSNTSIGLAASGTGSVPSFTATNNTSAPITATITVTPTSPTLCVGTVASYTITVNPTPTVASTSSQSLCAGSSTSAVSFTGSITGTTYNWTNTNPLIGLAASGTGDIASFTATNSSNANISGTITVTPVANGCSGSSSNFTISVRTVPNVTVPSNQVYITGANVPSQTFTGTVPGTVYNWTNTNTTIGLPAQGNGDINGFTAINNTSSPVTSTITVSPTNQFSYTVYRTHNGNGSTTQYSNFAMNANDFDVLFDVANSNTTVWSNGTSNPTIILNWQGYTNLNAAGISTPGGDYFGVRVVGSFTAAETGVYTFELQGDDAVDLFLDGQVAVAHYGGHGMTSNTGTISLVAGQTYNLVARHQEYGGGEGFILRWKRPSQSTFSIQPDELAGCDGLPQSFTITVDPIPTVNAPADVVNCEGSLTTVDFTGTTSNTNYLWTNSNTAIGLPASGSNDLSFTSQNPTNVAQTATVVVTPQAYVTQGYVWGSVTENNVLTLNAPAGKVFTSVEFASYGNPDAPVNGNFTLGTCDATSSSSVISALAIGNTTMTVTADNATFGDPCTTTNKSLAVKLGYGESVTGTPQTFTITVNPSASIANSFDTICTGTAFTFSTSSTDIVPANTSYTWTVNSTSVSGTSDQTTALASISQTLLNLTSVDQVVNYTVTPFSGSASCAGAPFNYAVTVTALPTTISAAGSTNFCDGGSVTLLAPVAPIGMSYTYQWNLDGSAIAGANDISYIAMSSGSYTVTVTNNLGCTAESSPITITVYALPSVASITGTTDLCVDGSSTLTSATSGGTWSTSNNAIATVDASTGLVTGVSAGSATISYTITDVNGCVASQTTSVNINSLPSANILATGALTFCDGGSVTLSASPIVAGNTYLWSTGETASSIVVSTSATVSLTITSAAGCSATSLPMSVVANTNPTATITAASSTTFCDGGSVTLTANAGSGFSYQWSNNTNNQVITTTTAGSYTVTVTDANGCSTTSAPTVVTVNALPTTAAITGTAAVCINGTTLLSTTASSPVWSSSNTAIATVAANGLVTGISAGTVDVSYSITNVNGCTSTETVTVTVNELPTATIATVGSATFCQGGSVTLIASNAPAGMTYTYQWNLGGTAITGATSNTYVANASGNYSVSITTNSGCTATSAATIVTVNPLPVLTAIIGSTSVCENGTVSIANAQSGGLWSTSDNTIATINAVTGVVTGVNPGTTTLTYTYTNANGCMSSVSTNFTVNALPSAIITANGPTTFCQGSSVVLTASSGSSYLWSTGETTQSITVNSTADISVAVTNANGCTSTSATTSVIMNALPLANITSLNGNSFCQGASITLVASPGASYAWSNGANTQSITVSSSQNLTVTVTNAQGCSATSAPFSVTMNPSPIATVTANGPTTFCDGGSVTLSAPTGASYLWSSGETTQTISASVDGPYTVTITDANGCSATSANMDITVLDIPNVQAIAGNNAVCEGSTILLTSATINGVWSSSNSVVASIDATGLVSGLQAGSSNISYTVTNANGCSNAVTMTLNVNAVPVLGANTGVTSVCQGSTTTLSNAQTSGTWTSSNVGIATVAANGVVSGITPGSATISYTYTNSNGCTSSVSTVVTVNDLPSGVISANGPTTFCDGGSVELQAPSAVSYAWSNGSSTSSIVVSSTGNYDVVITDANGCSSAITPMMVTVNALPNAAIASSGSSVCLGSTVTLTASGGTGYVWSNNATTASIDVVAANTYSVTVTDANGCVNTASEVVTFNANPAVTIAANGPTVFCQGGSLTLTATGGSNYVWSNGDQGSSTTVSQSGAYFVIVTNASGCTTQSAIVNVTVNAAPVVAPITGANAVCEGGNMTLSSATIGGVWTSANNFIATIDGAGNVTGLNAGSTTMTYTVTNNGCTASSVAQVNVLNNPVSPTITASGTTTVCPGGSVVLFASNAPNYQWNNGPTTAFIVATQSGDYTVTTTGLNGCSATSLPITVFIGDNTAPVITAPLNVTVTPNLGCEAIGVSLGTPVTSDNCSVASVSNDAPAIYPIGTTTVTWTVTDAAGNISTATQLVNVVDQTAPTAIAPADVVVTSNNYCEATGVQLGMPNATDNCTNDLVVTNNAPETYPLGNTIVTWTITDAAGNITTVDQTVTVVDESAPIVLLANTSVILDAEGYASISFEDLNNGSYDNCGISSAVLSQSAFDCSNVGNNLISVTLTDNNGNQSTAQVMVTVVASDACGSANWSGPSVPDAFTPNGNNFNDTWVIPGLEGYNTKEMAVYSRYGTLVHYSSQYNNDWDGTLLNTGTPVPDGTYYYILNLDGGKQLNGYVYINRVKQ